MRILLQFPEGLKQKALEYSEKLQSEGNEVFVSASPTFGACDLALDEAKALKVDKLVHFGHAEFHKVDFNVEYIDYKIDASLEILASSLPYLSNFTKIGLVTTIQHIHQIEDVKRFYESNGKTIVIGRPYGFAKRNGQILGCDIGSAASIDREVEAIIYFGGGIFHPLGALLATTKPLLDVDPFDNRIEFLDLLREKYKKKSKGKVLSAIRSERFGILVSTKNGQHNIHLAEIIKRKIESKGLKAAILVSNTFDFDSLNNMMEFDAFVNTACPRIASDDTERIRKPLLSANELMEALSAREEVIQYEKTGINR